MARSNNEKTRDEHQTNLLSGIFGELQKLNKSSRCDPVPKAQATLDAAMETPSPAKAQRAGDAASGADAARSKQILRQVDWPDTKISHTSVFLSRVLRFF